MFPKLFITIYMALALTMTIRPPLQAQTSPASVVAIQAAVQSYPKQIASLSCKFTVMTTLNNAFLQENNIPEGALPSVQVEQAEWAVQGNKVITNTKLIQGDATTLGHDMETVRLFDGNYSYSINMENGGHAGRRFTYGDRQHLGKDDSYWSPLQFGYKFSGQWLSDVLSSNNPTLERAGIDPVHGQLYLVHLNIGKLEEHIWFAPKYGDMAVKIMEGTPSNEAIWTGSQYKRVGNLWMATEGDWQLVITRPNQPTIVQVDKKFIFSDIQVNNVPDETFEFKWPTGASLYDNDTRTKYYRDASGNWVKRTDIAEALVHTPSRVSAADFAPWVLLVSLTTLLTLGYLRWRRRASA